MSEKNDVMHPIMAAATVLGHRLFRNNTFQGVAGRFIRMVKGQVYVSKGGEFITFNGRVLDAGLTKSGSSDNVGWTRIKITPEMVGKTVAIFTAVESKTQNGRASEAQQSFIDLVTRAGGIAFFSRSSENYQESINNCIESYKNCI